jgi:hypothetical protein
MNNLINISTECRDRDCMFAIHVSCAVYNNNNRLPLHRKIKKMLFQMLYTPNT